MGGWGDPANDYQISTGGFKDLAVAYPTPHRIRRNFTLYPYDNPNFVAPFPFPKGLMINTTMTTENVDFIVNNYEGDFFGFQTYFESAIVSLALPDLIFRFGCLTLSNVGAAWGYSPSHGRVSTRCCPARSFPLTGFSRDMGGTCPNGAAPPDCYAGAKWPPNDPLFFLHHAVGGSSAPSSRLAHVDYVDGR